MIRFKKYIKKILIGFTALTGLITAIAVPSLAYSEDSDGNLLSDNILKIEDVTKSSLGVNFVCQNNQITLNGTALQTGPVWFDINISSGTYTLQDYNSFTYNDGFRISLRTGYGSLKASLFYNTINDTTTFTSSTDMDILAVSVVQGVTYNNVVLRPTLVVGSTPLTSYEPFGAVYYSQDNYNNALLNDYGIFRLCSSIQLTLTYTDSTQVDTYSWDSILSLINDKSYVKCNNGVFSYNNSSLSTDLLNGSSNATAMWQFNFNGTYPQVKQYPSMIACGYNLRYQIIDIDNVLFAYDNITNDHIIDLSEYQYKQIGYFQLYTGAVGIAVNFTSLYFETSYDVAYTKGYNDGETAGYQNGYYAGETKGYNDGKDFGYDAGYSAGLSIGEQSDIATNGFMTLLNSIMSYPVNMIRSVFNFEFMGINIAGLITFIVSIVIVIFIVHRFKK